MTAPTPMRIAVVGLGPMGMHHVRAMADVAGARLVAVADVDRARADETATAFNCRALYNAADLVGVIDAAVIATPPEHHAAAAVPLLNAGIACLVEKPLAMSEADCTAIIAAAKNTPVSVGQIERFNPATETLFAAGIAPADIRAIDVRRHSPASGRQVPVDVVSDMMIHDLEIVLALKQSPVVSVAAKGVSDDWATAELTFADGATARLSANRKAEARIRELKLRTAKDAFHLDFMARTVTKNDAPLPVHLHDALRAEIADVLDAARHKTKPRVSAYEAREAMRVAWRILGAITS